MQKKGALILLILLVIVIILSIIIKDEEQESPLLPIENTIEMAGKKDTLSEKETRFKLNKEHKAVPIATPKQKAKSSTANKLTDSFTLVNTKAQTLHITLSDEGLELSQLKKPIIIVNLFATWCPPCTGQMPYLKDLQKKHQNKLFIVGVLTHDSIDKDSFESFMSKKQINYFISYSKDNDNFADHMAEKLNLDKNFSIPLTVMYLDGEYFTHYEGAVPVEMIEYDIQQAKKQLN